MRIAHFVQRYPPALGGSEAFFGRLSRYFAATGDSVKVFTTTALDLEAFWKSHCSETGAGVTVEEGVAVHRYPVVRWPGRRYFLKAASLVPHRQWQCMTQPCNPIAWRMWTAAGRTDSRYDIVHAAALPYAWPIVCAMRLARRSNSPFVITPFLHVGDPADPRDPTSRQYLAPPFVWLLGQASCIFVQTSLERGALIEAGIDREKIVLLGMGVAEEECTGGDRDCARRGWHAGPNEVVIGHLANNSVEKGSVDLLRAAERAWNLGAHFRLVLAGPEMPNFRRFWGGYRSAVRVMRLGPLSESEKRDFFAGIDLFALPSRSDSFGLVILEAWANKVPTVAYRAGGVAEVIRDHVDGSLVRCGDVEGLASALSRLCEVGALRRQLGSTGHLRVQREFRWSDKLERVREVYEGLVRGE
jgi:glycosyltransferase involved in cell wall biosynthesis